MSKLKIWISFNINTENCEVVTNVKREALKDLLGDVVRSKVGLGSDESKPNDHDVYEICSEIDLKDDSISTSSNCGNKGLETGILMGAFQRMTDEGYIRR